MSVLALTTCDESDTCKQIADLRDRASHHEKAIAELEKTLDAVQSETLATEKAVASQSIFWLSQINEVNSVKEN